MNHNYQIVGLLNSLEAETLETETLSPKARVVIAHYHLFKNAGTSIDSILQKNFADQWTKVEFSRVNRQSNSKNVQDWLDSQEDISAFSSHTAMFPLPVLEDIVVLPIVFLRHPIDRLWSVYKFERKHKKILNESIRLAKSLDFAGYLNYQLDQPRNRSCRNFQTYRLSWLESKSTLSELERALAGLELLPIVGLVEEFKLSMELYGSTIAQYYPRFEFIPVHKNATSETSLTLAEKLEVIRYDLDPETYARLLTANEDDLKLYHAAKNKLDRARDPKA